MNRYLLNVSYIGTMFRGMQKSINKAEEITLDPRSIQGCLEIALAKIRPINNIDVVVSSRTDAGVHALQSSVHVDLENSHGTVYPTQVITSVLNKQFYKQDLQIRVLKTHHVPNTFHCRYNAKERTYLYRLAIAKESLFSKGSSLPEAYVSFIPIEELERCHFIQDSTLNIEIFKEAAQMFVGVHDFRTFMQSNSKDLRQNHARFTLRYIASIKIEPGRSLTNGSSFKRAQNFYNYWDITIKGRSFLHNQIRRIIGCLIAVAKGRISMKDVYEMITIPSKNSWNTRAQVAPPYALYLSQVRYDENDFKFNSVEEINAENIQSIGSIKTTKMSFLEELRKNKLKLKSTETLVTYADGKKFIVSGEKETQLQAKSLGFVVDTKPDTIPACILDNKLFLGSQDSVDMSNIKEFGITHILSVGINTPNIELDPSVTCKFLPCLDLPETDLKAVCQISNKFLSDAFDNNGTVLVHCNAGVSRAASIVLGYLISCKNFTFEEAFKLAKMKRQCIQPNTGFLEQLKRF